jgi:hypothetical protein
MVVWQHYRIQVWIITIGLIQGACGLVVSPQALGVPQRVSVMERVLHLISLLSIGEIGQRGGLAGFVKIGIALHGFFLVPTVGPKHKNSQHTKNNKHGDSYSQPNGQPIIVVDGFFAFGFVFIAATASVVTGLSGKKHRPNVSRVHSIVSGTKLNERGDQRSNQTMVITPDLWLEKNRN